jgi:hypothetical protein
MPDRLSAARPLIHCPRRKPSPWIRSNKVHKQFYSLSQKYVREIPDYAARPLWAILGTVLTMFGLERLACVESLCYSCLIIKDHLSLNNREILLSLLSVTTRNSHSSARFIGQIR